MNGSINPNGVSTSGYFEWGTSATMSAYDVTAVTNVGAGTSAVAMISDRTSVACGSTFYYRAVAPAPDGSAVLKGSIVAATTSQCPTTAAPTIGLSVTTMIFGAPHGVGSPLGRS